MSILEKWLRVEMPDGSKYAVPVATIARNRAESYKDEYGDSLQRSLVEDTLPYFEHDPYEVEDWAANNMNWEDVAHIAIRLPEEVRTVDFQEGWVNGPKTLIDDPTQE